MSFGKSIVTMWLINLVLLIQILWFDSSNHSTTKELNNPSTAGLLIASNFAVTSAAIFVIGLVDIIMEH
jgi:hypothetical protein